MGMDIPRLGSRQKRVLHGIRELTELDGGAPICWSSHGGRIVDIGSFGQWGTGDGFRFIPDREVYKIAERLEELGLVEIDIETFMVRTVSTVDD